MFVDRLLVKGVRNLEPATLTLHPQFNIICGPNGSGKTSLLEALHFLSLGRSHRSAQQNCIINCSEQTAAIFAGCQGGSSQQRIIVKTIKHREQEKKAYIGGSKATRAQTASLIPLQIINEESSKIIFQGPEIRRKFLDWLVFYANHNYQALYRDFNRVLQQRNSLLKHPVSLEHKAAVLNQIDQVFIELAEKIHQARQHAWAEFLVVLKDSLRSLQVTPQLKPAIVLLKGWENDLRHNLSINRELDCKNGLTLCGPHRADLQIWVQGHQAKTYLSRGQGKILAIALLLARAVFIAKNCYDPDKASIMLIDDLSSELDQNNLFKVVRALQELTGKMQIFIAATAEQPVLQQLGSRQYRLFRLQQGQFVGQA